VYFHRGFSIGRISIAQSSYRSGRLDRGGSVPC
jgi:hypothetical protein